MDNNVIDLYVGSKIGSFKHVKYFTDVSKNDKNCIKNLVDIKNLVKEDGITCMAWGDAIQSEILIGNQHQNVQIYNIHQGFMDPEWPDVEFGDIVGIGRLRNNLVAAVSSGDIKVCTDTEVIILQTGGSIKTMKVHEQELVAAGGEENDVKIWNMELSVPVFTGKNLPQDWLQLRRPVWVSDLCFLDASTLAVCSKHGYVRLFDTRTQRRPVCNVETSMAANCMSSVQDDRQVVVGFGRGEVHAVDLRQRRLDKGYKGATGAITAVERVGNLLFSAGLDRQLRVHNYHTKQLVYKRYMTSKISTFLIKTEGLLARPYVLEANKMSEDISVDLDNVFQDMETVGVDTNDNSDAGRSIKRKRMSVPNTPPIMDGEAAIKLLLKKTELLKRRNEKKKRERKARSVFYDVGN